MRPREPGLLDTSHGTEDSRAGLVRPLGSMMCTVTVITADVADLVRAAGGWIFDRTRAGWRVSAYITSQCDVTPLLILGVRSTFIDASSLPALSRALHTSLVCPSGALAQNGPPNVEIRALMRSSITEVTVWGDGKLESERRFHHVQHRLSPAAQHFKALALRSAGLSPVPDAKEYFRCHAPWYPLDGGADLEPVSGD